MAATKRRRSTKRRTVRASNPKRRTRKSTTVARRRSTRRNSFFSRTRRRSNPVARRRGVRRRGRRRNPIGGGVIGEGFKLAIAGMAIGAGQKYVRQLIGGFLPAGPIANGVVTLGTGYGLGWLAGLVPINFVKGLKRPLELSGWALFGAQVITSYLLPALSSVTGGAGMSGWNAGYRRGPRGIGVVTDVPPYIVSPQQAAVAPPPPSANGMQGFASVPGAQRRWS